ncbi:MAG: hypothetical protein ACRC2R_05460 [Xenococcaceae cyanobacterium]
MNNRSKTLLVILIINILITSFHYIDNAISLSKYPEPDWITGSGVYMTWAILTIVGLVGYWLYRQNKLWLAYFCLGIYSITGLSSPTHYFYGAMSDFSVKMHALIWLDAIAGALIVLFVLRSLLWLREWQAEIRTN